MIGIMSGLPNDELLHESVLQELAIHVARESWEAVWEAKEERQNDQTWSHGCNIFQTHNDKLGLV